MQTMRMWLSATRPKTLAAGISPVLLGTIIALSKGFFSPLLFSMTLLTALGIQISCNLANDYFDFLKGADTESRKGPLRVTQAGLVSLPSMKNAILLTLTSTALTGLYLAFYGGIGISLLLALSLLLSILYTGGPYPLAYLGLGDLFVFVFFGPVAATGTFFLQTGFFSWDVVLIGCAAGAIATAILATNNLRDIEEDALASKKTLAVRFGKSFTQIEYLSCLLIAAFIPFYFMSSHPYSLLSLSFLPFAISSIKTVFSYKDPRELNTTLAKTGQLLLIYTLSFSIGWMI